MAPEPILYVGDCQVYQYLLIWILVQATRFLYASHWSHNPNSDSHPRPEWAETTRNVMLWILQTSCKHISSVANGELCSWSCYMHVQVLVASAYIIKIFVNCFLILYSYLPWRKYFNCTSEAGLQWLVSANSSFFLYQYMCVCMYVRMCMYTEIDICIFI